VGTTAAGDGTPVTLLTSFEAMSLTKPVFAYSVMLLVEQGTVDLDRPVRDLLGDLDRGLADLTPRQLLSHTSGLLRSSSGGEPVLADPPGSRFRYSADGYLLRQDAVERVTGQPLDRFVRDQVLVPLGMRYTTLISPPLGDTHARGHDERGVPVAPRSWATAKAAASLSTTVADFAAFLSARLDPDLGLLRGTLSRRCSTAMSTSATISVGRWAGGWSGWTRQGAGRGARALSSST
jgi:CubicO group peptidase (beta-lactamase class C family)